MEYDHIAVAVMSEGAQRAIHENLQRLGCDGGRIKCIDMGFVRSEELANGLCLPQEFRAAWLDKQVWDTGEA